MIFEKNYSPLVLTVVANDKRLPINELAKTISRKGESFSLSLVDHQILDEEGGTAVDFFLTEKDRSSGPDDRFIAEECFRQLLENFFYELEYDFCMQSFDPITRRKKVLFSDMDSTLIKNETLDDIASKAGIGEQVAEITREGIEGKINFHESMQKRLSLLKGVEIYPLIDKVNNDIQYNQGAHSLIKTLNHFGVVTHLVTGGFDPIASQVKENLGMRYLVCNRFEMSGTLSTGNWNGDLVTGEKKLETLETFLLESGMILIQAMAIGDGANDIPMLKAAALGVGYRARDKVKKEISHQIQFTPLTTLLYYQGYHKSEFIDDQ